VADDDGLPDLDDVAAGAWDDGPYGRGDSLGSYREVTPEKSARALAALDLSRPVRTFTLATTFFPGYPGWGGRSYLQSLVVSGTDPGPGFPGEVLSDRPRGPNAMTSFEERVELTWNIGSKINGLAHAGLGPVVYGGRRQRDLVAPHGVRALDTTTWGRPLLTRGLLVDVLAAKLDAGGADVDTAPDGRPVLRGNYRITLEDLTDAIARQDLPALEPGDAVFLRTGWSALVRTDPARFLRGSPGVWLRETRWLAATRPALVGTDSWCWGCNDRATIGGAHGACHQELLVRHGIRIGEGLTFEELADAGVDRFVLCHNPVRADGAVSTIAPATAIANERSADDDARPR
jgi:kynurenine formamidase